MIRHDHEWRKPFLVVTALAPVLRGQPGRNPGDNDDTTKHLSGRSGRVLAFGLAFVISASRMTRRERVAGCWPSLIDHHWHRNDFRLVIFQ
jgi:hypothetical protein